MTSIIEQAAQAAATQRYGDNEGKEIWEHYGRQSWRKAKTLTKPQVPKIPKKEAFQLTLKDSGL